jgi:exosortase
MLLMSQLADRRTVGVRAPLLSVLLCMPAILFGFDSILDRILPRWLGVWDYSHGYLVVGMAGWALLDRLRDESPVELRPSWVGWSALLAMVLIYTLLQQIDFTLGMSLILLPVVASALWTCGGTNLLRMGFVPILLLVYAIPVWDLLVRPLQDLATVVVRSMLIASGIPTFAEGHTLTTSRAAVAVAPSCSGLTFLLAALTISTFYAGAWLRRFWPAVILILVSVVIAITSNWVRIYAIAIAGHLTDMTHYLIVEDHELFGWAVFSVFMVGVIAFARWLENEFPSEVAPQPRRVVPTEDRKEFPFKSRLVVTVSAVIVLMLPALFRPEAAPDRHAKALVLSGTKAIENKWSGATPWYPMARNPDGELRALAELNGSVAHVYLARYLKQQPNGKVAATGHDLEGGWSRTRSSIRTVADLEVQEIDLVQGNKRRLVWFWYHIGGRSTPGLASAKLFEAIGLLEGNLSGAVIAVSAECVNSCEIERTKIETFIERRVSDLHLLAGKS